MTPFSEHEKKRTEEFDRKFNKLFVPPMDSPLIRDIKSHLSQERRSVLAWVVENMPSKEDCKGGIPSWKAGWNAYRSKLKNKIEKLLK